MIKPGYLILPKKLWLTTFCLLHALLPAAPIPGTDNPQAVDAITHRLLHPDLSERVQAVLQLLEMGDSAKVAYPALVKVLADDPNLDAAIAARSLFVRSVSPGDVPQLIHGLKLNTWARAAAAWQLGHVRTRADKETIRALIEALEHTDKHERNYIVVSLAVLAPPDEESLAAIQRVLKDAGSTDSPHTNYKYPRTSASLAVGMTGFNSHPSIPDLLGILSEKQVWEYQRSAACFSLGRIGSASKDAISALELALKDESQIVGKYAKLALEAIQSKSEDSLSERSVSTLINILHNGQGRIEPQIVEALARLGAFAGSQSVKLNNKSRPAVHESVSLAIGYLDSLTQPPYTEQIANEYEAGTVSSEVRQYIMALGGVQQGIGPAILEALTEAEQNPRVMAIRQLSKLGPLAKSAIASIRTAMDDPDWIVRREAFLALNQIESR